MTGGTSRPHSAAECALSSKGVKTCAIGAAFHSAAVLDGLVAGRQKGNGHDWRCSDEGTGGSEPSGAV